jgi:hypothetical protein
LRPRHHRLDGHDGAEENDCAEDASHHVCAWDGRFT